MDEREQKRKVRHRLATLRHADEATGNVAAMCRDYGISRPAFCKWHHRYQSRRWGLRDRSSQPHNGPNATKAGLVGKIIYLRQHYHFGPLKISMYLARYDDTDQPVWGVADPHNATAERQGRAKSSHRC